MSVAMCRVSEIRYANISIRLIRKTMGEKIKSLEEVSRSFRSPPHQQAAGQRYDRLLCPAK